MKAPLAMTHISNSLVAAACLSAMWLVSMNTLAIIRIFNCTVEYTAQTHAHTQTCHKLCRWSTELFDRVIDIHLRMLIWQDYLNDVVCEFRVHHAVCVWDHDNSRTTMYSVHAVCIARHGDAHLVRASNSTSNPPLTLTLRPVSSATWQPTAPRGLTPEADP